MSKILLVNGPSGAGKTTISKAFLKKAKGTWAYINQDEIRQLIIAGYASADDYEENYTEETRQQIKVSVPICADLVKRYYENNINCIVDFFATPETFKTWKEYLGDTPYKLVVLMPNQKVNLKRNAERDYGRLKRKKIIKNHTQMQAWKNTEVTILDTSSQEIAETTASIKNLLHKKYML